MPPKEIVKSLIDLANIAKGLMYENQQPSKLERLSPSTRGRRRRGESRELYWVGAGESSAAPSTTKQIWGWKNLQRFPVNLLFLPCKTHRFQIC